MSEIESTPSAWWWPSEGFYLIPRGGGVYDVLLPFGDGWETDCTPLDELPADAVRLVPENEGLAPRAAEIIRDLVNKHEAGAVPDTGHPAADARGASVWLGREDWGVVIDALIEHRASAVRRKAGNSESTSDVRVEVCDRIVGDLTGVLAQPYPLASASPSGDTATTPGESR